MRDREMRTQVPSAEQTAPDSRAPVFEGTRFTKADLLSLVGDFSHDVRSPLTVISEFSSMLREGVISKADERDEATGTICDKAAQTLLLVDVLEMLVRAGCDSIKIRREVCQAAQVLRAAAARLEELNSFRRDSGGSRWSGSPVEIHCDPSLAALALVHMWIWMRRNVKRDTGIRLGMRPVPELRGVLFLAAKNGPPIDGKEFARMICPIGESDIPAGVRPVRPDLTLRVACELGRLAGGDVFVVGDRAALALYVPTADEHRDRSPTGDQHQ